MRLWISRITRRRWEQEGSVQQEAEKVRNAKQEPVLRKQNW